MIHNASITFKTTEDRKELLKTLAVGAGEPLTRFLGELVFKALEHCLDYELDLSDIDDNEVCNVSVIFKVGEGNRELLTTLASKEDVNLGHYIEVLIFKALERDLNYRLKLPESDINSSEKDVNSLMEYMKSGVLGKSLGDLLIISKDLNIDDEKTLLATIKSCIDDDLITAYRPYDSYDYVWPEGTIHYTVKVPIHYDIETDSIIRYLKTRNAELRVELKEAKELIKLQHVLIEERISEIDDT